MKDTSISNLLNAFSLPTDGAVAMKKRRFKYFIEVVINAWKRQRYWRDLPPKTEAKTPKSNISR